MVVIRTHSKHPAFVALVSKLDAYLKITDQDEHEFYNQFNGIDLIKYVVLIRDGEEFIACGARKAAGENVMEVKRMYTKSSARGRGAASKVLTHIMQ